MEAYEDVRLLCNKVACSREGFKHMKDFCMRSTSKNEVQESSAREIKGVALRKAHVQPCHGWGGACCVLFLLYLVTEVVCKGSLAALSTAYANQN